MYEKYAELRDLKGITDYRVASDTGITKSTFTDWKTGRSKPKVDKLKILADYFGVVLVFLRVGGDVSGELDCGRKCMGSSALLENNEKDTAGVIQTVSCVRATYLFDCYSFCNSAFNLGFNSSNCLVASSN